MYENPILAKESLKEPSLWRLALYLAPDALHVMLFSTVEENSLIYQVIAYDKAAPSPLKALEDAIYDNPVLLNEFSRVDCAIATDKFAVVPMPLNADETREKIFHALFGDFGGEIISNDLQGQDAAMLMGVPCGLTGFLRRTFNGVNICHHLAPLCNYFFQESSSAGGRNMYANFGKEKLDLVVFFDNALKLANSYAFRDPMDAAYYILACRHMLEMNASSDGLFIAGDPSAREKVSPILRERLSYVMPVPFPGKMFNAGKDALNAPFCLTALCSCE